MKKRILSLVILVMLAGSAFTVYNYNKSQAYNKSDITKNGGISLPKKSIELNKESSKAEAIDFKLKDLNGKEVSLSDYKGKKVFLNFFATWCPPCKAEMPEIEKLYQETKDSDLVILAVDLGETTATVNKFITNNKYNFQVLQDSDNTVAAKYNVVSIPTSFFIDKEGNIVDKHIGAMSIEDMKGYINKLN